MSFFRTLESDKVPGTRNCMPTAKPRAHNQYSNAYVRIPVSSLLEMVINIPSNALGPLRTKYAYQQKIWFLRPKSKFKAIQIILTAERTIQTIINRTAERTIKITRTLERAIQITRTAERTIQITRTAE